MRQVSQTGDDSIFATWCKDDWKQQHHSVVRRTASIYRRINGSSSRGAMESAGWVGGGWAGRSGGHAVVAWIVLLPG